MNDTKLKIATATVALLSTVVWASPVSPVARKVIPADVRQIISVDYRTVRNSDTAMALKAQALPDNLKEFEYALKSVGVNPDRDLESLTFASFDNGKQGLQVVAIASGGLSRNAVLNQTSLRNTKPVKYHGSDVYALSKTMTVTVLEDDTLLLGNDRAVKTALDVRDGSTPNVDSNREMTDMIKTVQKAPVWSVLDRQGSQKMLLSVLGDAGKLPDFENIQKRVLGSRYMMNFNSGFSLYTDVLTSDITTSTVLSSLLKAGVLYKKVTANPAQKLAWENVKVTKEDMPPSDHSHLKMQLRVDQKQFQDLLKSGCFIGMASERKELSGLTSWQMTDEFETRSGGFAKH